MVAEARAFDIGIGERNIDALEIGNEPELYPITPFYYVGPNQTPRSIHGRGPTTGPPTCGR